MSVYKRKGAETYSYDFQFGGDRYSGDTGQTKKRDAVAEQERIREALKAERKKAAQAKEADMTFDVAMSRYWEQIGQHHKDALNTLAALEWLVKHLGAKKRIRDIDDNRVAALVARRRNEKRKVGKASERDKQRKVSPATVNRTMTEPLRKIMTRARKVWKVPVQEIAWSTHILAEPRERIREASMGEEHAIMGKLERGYDAAVSFAFLSGCRRMEIVGLVWSRVDFFGKQFTVIGKGGHVRVIPMSDALYTLIWAQRGRHPEAVFAYTAKRTDKRKGICRGEIYPMTDAGLRTAMRRAVKGGGVENFHFHDIRHTAATRVLRASNLRVAQNLLGHRDPTTTAKYAHALGEDIRAALNAATPTKSPTDAGSGEANNLREMKKSG